MKIAVVGTGYVGLVAGACFADTGNTVTCVDKNPEIIDRLRRGEIPIYEPGLDALVRRGASENRLLFTESTAEAVQSSEIVFLAVGTPPTASGDPDLKYLKSAAEAVGKAIQPGSGTRIIVNKSTVPVGAHLQVTQWISSQTEQPFETVSNPEFLKEGSAVDDFLKPDRVIIGAVKEETYRKMAELYAPFVRQGNPVIWMDPTSAEITKYACNAFLATKISFMNELAVFCEKMGGDIEIIRKGMTSDVRIGRHFMYPGVGYGGSCFPKDVQALMAIARKNEVEMGIIAAAEAANKRQKSHLVNQVKRYFKDDLKGRTFAIWGLAFKPNTDDIREAPSLVIIEELLKAGAKVRAFDPVASENVKTLLGTKIELCKSSFSALEGAEALLLVTEWNEFRNVDFEKVKTLLKTPVIFDGRNIYDKNRLEAQGFEYYGVGRGVK